MTYIHTYVQTYIHAYMQALWMLTCLEIMSPESSEIVFWVGDKVDPDTVWHLEGTWHPLPTHPSNEISKFIVPLANLQVIVGAVSRTLESKVYELQGDNFTWEKKQFLHLNGKNNKINSTENPKSTKFISSFNQTRFWLCYSVCVRVCVLVPLSDSMHKKGTDQVRRGSPRCIHNLENTSADNLAKWSYFRLNRTLRDIVALHK